MNIPIVITKAGAQPQSPAALRAKLLALVSASNPDYTANLPGSLIEDIASTDTGATVLMDSARVDLINSLTPFGANEFLMNQLGQIYGVSPDDASKTAVYCLFAGTVGFIIAQGFTVSDGSHQYTVKDGGTIGSGGVSSPLFCVAVQAGSWAVPANSVNTLITSVPSNITLSVNNPQAGTPGGDAESPESFRSGVLQAGLAASQGMSRYLKTLLGNVTGVQPRLISARQLVNQWEIIVGGGDPYEVANAIYTALFDISSLTGSVLQVGGITNANPGVVTTLLNHGFASGQVINIAGVVGMSGVNNTPLTITVLTEKTFSIGTDTTSSGSWVSGGIVTPNLRNIAVSLIDYPDTYVVPFVNPPEQTVSIALTWNTSSPNFVSGDAVAQAGSQALADYVNTVPVGLPMNLFELQAVFQAAIADLVPPQFLTRMVFSVSINGIGTPPDSGTGIIAGDPESFFTTTPTAIVITQG